MSWLSNVVRPKLQEWVGGGREVPDHLWQQCPACQQMIFHRELEKNLRVCQHCDHHLRLGVDQRLDMLFDGGTFATIDAAKVAVDPLKFRDLRRYSDRLREAQAKTGRTDALVAADGTIGGLPAVVAAFDFAFMGGSMGIAVGEGFLAAAARALERGAALIAIPASGGARMQEGILSLMQMARTTVAVGTVRDARLPYIVILTDPTTGGVSASFASLGDITLAEPGAVIGFAGARVIRETIRQTLPDDFQKAEYLLDHGMIDAVVHRHRLRQTLIRILGLLLRPRGRAAADDAAEAAIPPAPLAPPAAGGAAEAPGSEPERVPE
jgi:acetyl-CoA carboxylase carboxyl transferase subunit beta